MGNTILNSLYGSTYNEYDNNTFKIHLAPGQELYMNSDMSYFSDGCRNLLLNLDTFNVNYAYVTDINSTYCNCSNLTGSPVCGAKVASMYNTYQDCYNITGSPVCGPNVINIWSTYYDCPNLSGNMYMQSNNLTNTTNMLYNHNKSKRLNIWVYSGTTTNSSLYKNKVGCGNWSTSTNCYYNSANNIYVYYNWNGVIW